MPESPPEAPSPEARPWWESTPAGEPVLLAFVRISRASLALGGKLSGWMGGLRQRARYVAGVEYIAASSGAAQPLWWQNDAVTLFFKGNAQGGAAEHAFGVAQVLLERMLADLALPVRLSVHAAVVPWSPEGEVPVDQEIEWNARLAESLPPSVIVLSEDVYLALPSSERDKDEIRRRSRTSARTADLCVSGSLDPGRRDQPPGKGRGTPRFAAALRERDRDSPAAVRGLPAPEEATPQPRRTGCFRGTGCPCAAQGDGPAVGRPHRSGGASTEW